MGADFLCRLASKEHFGVLPRYTVRLYHAEDKFGRTRPIYNAIPHYDDKASATTSERRRFPSMKEEAAEWRQPTIEEVA